METKLFNSPSYLIWGTPVYDSSFHYIKSSLGCMQGTIISSYHLHLIKPCHVSVSWRNELLRKYLFRIFIIILKELEAQFLF